MNIQPYGIPQGQWPPKMTPWWFHLSMPFCIRAMRKQKIMHVQSQGLEHLQRAVSNKHGVLLTPNHSFHWDSYCLVAATLKLHLPLYIMTAWQVFAACNWFSRMSLQRNGCFSVDREGTDVQALKTAVDVLQNRQFPLVVFPEGDVYHINDRVTPFRDGAAAMALMAARKGTRPVSIIPVAIKRWYREDPKPSLMRTIERLEQRLYWRPQTELPMADRIIQIARGILSLKELEHLRTTHSDSLSERIQRLSATILFRSEQRYGLDSKQAPLPVRIKEVRRAVIAAREAQREQATEEQQRQWARDMDDMFLVTQLYSYPGDYMTEKPSIERIAETLDKLEEDALGASYPTVHGVREVLVRFDQPIEIPPGKEKRFNAAELTELMEGRVQAMLDDINANAESH
ncbi:MAG: 1-acyl-sn-glycerol-3-phosphate acyltransferase [Pirellula sp.]